MTTLTLVKKGREAIVQKVLSLGSIKCEEFISKLTNWWFLKQFV